MILVIYFLYICIKITSSYVCRLYSHTYIYMYFLIYKQAKKERQNMYVSTPPLASSRGVCTGARLNLSLKKRFKPLPLISPFEGQRDKVSLIESLIALC